MAIKSILDIDVNDTEFTHFQDLFGKYTDALAKTPNVWKNVGKEQASMATQFERMTAALMAQNQLARERKEEDAKQLKTLTKSEQLWSNIGKHSTSLYRNVIGIGEGLLKWGSIAAGIGAGLAVGGLLGADKFANDVAGQRREAMGFGVSPAQMQAFSVNFGRIVDPTSFLGRMTEMETDFGKRGPWYTMMGGLPMSGNAERDSLAYMNRVRAWALRTPEGLLGTEAQAFQLPFSTEELMRMRGTGNKEWQRLMSGAGRDVGAFGLSNRAALAWQNLSTQFERSKFQMFDQLALSLGKLAGPLEKLSAGITHAAVAFLSSGEIKKGIDDLAKWLKGFSGKIDTKAFDTRVKQFMSDSGDVASGIHVIAQAMRAAGWVASHTATGLGLIGSGAEAVGGGIESAFGALNRGVWDTQGFFRNLFTNKNSILAAIDAQKGLPAGMLEFLSQHPMPGGAGPMGVNPATAGAAGVDTADLLSSAGFAGTLFAREMTRYHGNLGKALAAYAMGPGGGGDTELAKIMKTHPRYWQEYLPQEVQKIVKSGETTITIVNATGGSAVVAVNQTAGH